MFSMSICIDDLVASKKARFHPDSGKHFVRVIVAAKREKDQFDKDATCYIKQSDKDRKSGAKREYLGDGYWVVFDGVERPENWGYEVSLCLESMAPYTTFSEKNSKQYFNFSVTDKKEKDQYGNDAVVFVSQTKEQREAKTEKVYVGNAKRVQFGSMVAANPENIASIFAKRKD